MRLEMLSSILCFALAARQFHLTRPVLKEDTTLEVTRGRHLLQEQSVNAFIPNDCHMTETKSMIITGANSSGKSVYMKQVGMIVFMAQIGCFVPAEEAVIGIVDGIYTRIRTQESISSDESAFAIDLRQVRKAIDTATPRSLVLIDEFGKGTLAVDGASLLIGVIQYLCETSNPRCIIVTHLHEIFASGLLDSLPIRPFSMQLHVEDGQVCFLYHLREGTPSGDSGGIECAIRAGLPKELIQRCRELHALFSQGIPTELIAIQQYDDTEDRQLCERLLSDKLVH